MRHAWRHTRPQQLWLVFVVLVSMPFYFLSLELPKRIVNGPITGEGFESPGDTAPAFRVSIDLPDWIREGELLLVPSLDLDRLGTLVYLCLLFLGFVLINGFFKFYISTYKGRLGERMLRRMRFDLLDRTLRFPLSRFRRIRSSEVATMVKDEVEPLGGFIGDAFVTPAMLLAQAATALVFILIQNFWLGTIAATIVGVQVLVIPRLRRRLLVLGRERQLTARELAGRMGEVVEGIAPIRTNDTSNWERAEIVSRLARIFFIRFDIYQWKFLVKFLNTLLAQVTPFFFYLLGGYFVIRGRLDIGQLVAVIAAYRDLPSPLKDLIDWDQQRLDVGVKWAQLIEQFDVADTLDPSLQALSAEAPGHISEGVTISGLTLRDELGSTLLDGAALSIAPGESIAAVGPPGAGGEHMAEALARLAEPAAGRILVDGRPLASLPESFTGRRFAYSEGSTFLPQSTLYDALVYGLKHAPLRSATSEDERGERRRRAEALAAGNPGHDVADDWIDYEAAGASGPDELFERVLEVLTVVDMADDVYRLGLRQRPADAHEEKADERLLAARRDFRERLESADAERFVEPFDPERYLDNASVLENLVFGIVDADALEGQPIEAHPYMADVLARTDLDAKLLEGGRSIAETLIELFGDLSPDNPLLESMDLMSPEEIEAYRDVLRRLDRGNGKAPEDEDRRALMRLSLGYVEPRHRLGLLDDNARRAILSAREAFRSRLPESLAEAVHFHRPDTVNSAASLQDNVVFGRVVDSFADAAERSGALLRETFDALGLTDLAIRSGLRFEIGSGGKRLSAAQRQKLTLARALLKRPDLLIANRPLTALDAAAQEATIQRVLGHLREIGEVRPAVFWVLAAPSHARWFDTIVSFEGGRVTETRTGRENGAVAQTVGKNDERRRA